MMRVVTAGLKSRLATLAVASMALTPALGFADFCDILAGGGAQSCRANAESMGAKIFGSWLRTKPEPAQSGSGKKGTYSSGSTPAYGTFGVPHQGKLTMTLECFAGERNLSIQALPYMLGLTNGSNLEFKLKFKIDDRPEFTETWPLYWQRAELRAPQGSELASRLQGARDLVITAPGIVGRKSEVGYVYKVDGFDQMNAGLCR